VFTALLSINAYQTQISHTVAASGLDSRHANTVDNNRAFAKVAVIYIIFN